MKILMSILICCGTMACANLPETYIQADRRTYEAIAPEYQEYIESDSTLLPEQRTVRKQTLDSWDQRLDQWEAQFNEQR